VQGAKEDHASPARAPFYLLRDYLEGPPWLRKMVFRWPRNMYLVVTDPHRKIEFRPTGWAHFEAAVQPQGWYLRHLEGSPDYDIKRRGEPPEPRLLPKGKKTVVGANAEFYWYLGWGHEMLRLIPREGQPGYHPGTPFYFARISIAPITLNRHVYSGSTGYLCCNSDCDGINPTILSASLPREQPR